MKYRKLGNTGFDVSEIGFGTWQLGGERWTGFPDDHSINLLRGSRDLGINLFDVAVVYGQYKDSKQNLQSRSQELLGKAFQDQRDQVFYCLKLGQFDEYSHRHNYNPDRIIDQFNQSLRRLKTDQVDIALIHAPSISKIKDEKAITILQTLRALGKVKAVGYSFENEPSHVKEAVKQEIDVLMLQYNLIDRECKSSIKKAVKNGIGVLAGGPYKRGYLTGKYQSIEDIKSQKDDYWQWNLRYNRGKVIDNIEKVKNHLKESGTPEELRRKSLDFVLSQPISSAVIGHKSLGDIIENISFRGEK